MPFGQLNDIGFATHVFFVLATHEQTCVIPNVVGQLIGIVGAILEDNATTRFARLVHFRTVQRKSVMYADASCFGGDVGDVFFVGPKLRFLAGTSKNTVFDVVEKPQFVTAFNHLHTAVFGRGIIEHDHYGNEVGIGVWEKSKVLMPRKRAFAFGGGLGGEF